MSHIRTQNEMRRQMVTTKLQNAFHIVSQSTQMLDAHIDNKIIN